MPLELGAAFVPRQVVVVEDFEPAPPTVEDLRTEQLLTALAGLQDALNHMQAPVVNVAEPDLTSIVQAVTQLKGPATAEEIARAIKGELVPGDAPTVEPVLQELTAALKKLDFRMQAVGGSSGVGVSDINDRATRLLGKVDDDESQALLTTLRDTVLRRTDPLPAGTAVIGHVADVESLAVRQGRFRWSGGKATTSVTTPNASATLSNPAGSGVDLILTRYSAEVDQTADIVIVYDAVSSGTLMLNTNPDRRTTIANPGEMRVGSGVLTGGTSQAYIRRATTTAPVTVGPFAHRITPGKTFSVQFNGPGATNNVNFVVGWYAMP